MSSYVIGLDFGTDSVRALLTNCKNGEVAATDIFYYPRWKDGQYCDPSKSQFRQHPDDHLEGLKLTIKNCISSSGINPEQLKGICIDTTGSSPIAVDESGLALCYQPQFKDNPNTMVVLWKDHTAVNEADEINAQCDDWSGIDFRKYAGGIYSSEWFWSKILHIYREDSQLADSAYSWMEHCDYLTYQLVESKSLSEFRRSRCAAGHKALWHPEWGGLPDDAFLAKLDPRFPQLKSSLYTETYTSDQSAGALSNYWSVKLGLPQDVKVSVGTFDAHAAVVGAEAKENSLVRVMGTSTCDVIVSSNKNLRANTVQGICGQVDGSVLPGLVGLEAGQSAFGDLLAWFISIMTWSGSKSDIHEEEDRNENLIVALSDAASNLPVDSAGPLALDWINGRRTPDANQKLKAAIIDLNLGSGSPHIFKSLVEAICFGSRSIVERFEKEGVKISEVIGVGGIAKKSPFIIQTLADVLNRPIKIANTDQASALGSCMYAAVASGVHSDMESAIAHMGSGFEKEVLPRTKFEPYYDELFHRYEELGQFVESLD